jgi:DNA-binding transcriptional regulator GbsR (MarR family)
MADETTGDADFVNWFVERFAGYWQTTGAPRIEGRIAGYLLVSESPTGVSAEVLSADLGISRGSVSAYTRRLEQAGFIYRIRVRGERAHYFVMDADVWGRFLEQEQVYIRNQRTLAEAALKRAEPGTMAHRRIQNMRDYMWWLLENRELSTEWKRFKAERDASAE